MSIEANILKLKQDVLLLLAKIDRYKAQLAGIDKEIESTENYISWINHEMADAKKEELVDLQTYKKMADDLGFKTESLKSFQYLYDSVTKSKVDAEKELATTKAMIFSMQKSLDKKGRVYEFKIDKE